MANFLLFIGTTFLLISANNMEDLASILTHPVSQNVTVHQGQVNMSCEAKADQLIYCINNQSAEHSSVNEEGFVKNIQDIGQGKLRLDLDISLTKDKAGKNFEIFCRGYNLPESIPVDSEIALLKIAGNLSQPDNISVKPSADSFLISWTPPPTLDNTDILGYNVTVNNKSYPFIYSPEVHINYSDFSLCDSLNITVSGYNGVDGEIAKLPTLFYVPKSPKSGVDLPVEVVWTAEDENDGGDKFFFSILVDVAGLDCTGQRPSSGHVNISPTDDPKVTNKHELNLETSRENDEMMVSKESIEVKKDKEYHISVEFSNPLGKFNNTKSLYFCFSGKQHDKYMVLSVPCDDTTPNSTTSQTTMASNNEEQTRPPSSTDSASDDALLTKPLQVLAYLFASFTVCYFF